MSSTADPKVSRTQVAVVGAGPAGLMLTHLLHLCGIDTVAIDIRPRRQIEETHRAGILEENSVRLLADSGASERVLHEGVRHEGIELGFGGELHRVDFGDTCGSSTRLYPQTEVFIDLADARARDDGDVRFGVGDVSVHDLTGALPAMRFTDADGVRHEVRADILVGADGSRSLCRHEVPEQHRRQYYREYPFAWFGILCEAPSSANELIYNHSERGFALISQRTPELQRMYFQCEPDENPDSWSDDRIWAELHCRLQANGHNLIEGPITAKSVLPFRSFVQEPMRYGPLVLAGDAAHTVPPTGAKGLNLALADVQILAEVVQSALDTNDIDMLDAYSDRALKRVWKAQYFSYWMTTLLHRLPDAEPFDVRRQEGELAALVDSRAGSTYLAEAYCGWPTGT
jgi:4-hydroxybenzoate 3-monooxygenase